MSHLDVAIAGIGRMGAIHALHLHELAAETGTCRVAALVDLDGERARRFAADVRIDVPVFSTVDELAAARICSATIISTPTDSHRRDAARLIAAGHRVLLEKPLTGTLDGDREFTAELDRDYPEALMIAFQRRFDAPLQYAKQLMDEGLIGRVFKIHSALEDSNPTPNGYRSSGILPDMAVHNVDEILWLAGRMPRAALAVGSRVYSHRLTSCEEDFDDALLLLWFEQEMIAHVQVSRNHVSGYRVETVIYGEEGQIHVGRFEQRPLEIMVEAYGRRDRTNPLTCHTFSMRDYGKPLPEFVDRFGPAYKSEVAAFVECCRAGTAFPTSHRDGLRAQEVIAAGMRHVVTEDQANRLQTEPGDALQR